MRSKELLAPSDILDTTGIGTGYFPSKPNRQKKASPITDITDKRILPKLKASPSPNIAIQTITATAPEPSSIALLGLGLAGFSFMRRRKQNR